MRPRREERQGSGEAARQRHCRRQSAAAGQQQLGGRVFGIDSSAAEAGSGEVKEGTVSKQNKSERETKLAD